MIILSTIKLKKIIYFVTAMYNYTMITMLLLIVNKCSYLFASSLLVTIFIVYIIFIPFLYYFSLTVVLK